MRKRIAVFLGVAVLCALGLGGLGSLAFANFAPGDANGDGAIDQADLNLVMGHYNQSGGWSSGDFTGDGVVDGADFNTWLSCYASQSSGGSSPAAPEPTTWAALATALLGLAVYGWRKRR
jgi:hypothetical protein